MDTAGPRSWAKTALVPVAVPVVVALTHRTPGCGPTAHLVDSLLFASQGLVVLGILAAVTLAAHGASEQIGRQARGRASVAPESQSSPTMDDWDPPDRPTPGGEQYDAEDGPNVEGRFVLSVFAVAAVSFAVVLLADGYVEAGCVRGIFWIVG